MSRRCGAAPSRAVEEAKRPRLLAPTLAFKKVQTVDKYPKGQPCGRHWKHLRHLLKAADASSLPPDRPYCTLLPHPQLGSDKKFRLQMNKDPKKLSKGLAMNPRAL